MKSKMLIWSVITVFIISMLLVGCKTAANTTTAAAAETTAAGAAETTAGEKKVVKFMWAEYDGIKPEYIKDLEAAFEAANPDIDLQMISTSWNDYEARLDTFVAGGEAPDIA